MTSCLCSGTYGNEPKELLDEATDLPVCDYDVNATPLYKSLERHQWGAVSRFLKTGVWPGDFFSDKLPPRVQARTWIHRYDRGPPAVVVRETSVLDDHDPLLVSRAEGDAATYHNLVVLKQTPPKKPATAVVPPKQQQQQQSTLKWRQLPLHAALLFLAPPAVVKQLIELFPYALRCPDDKGMLPLHLAFRQAVPDDILTILLRLFPNGMHVRDSQGRLPVECVRMDFNDNNTNTHRPVRGMIIQSIMQQSAQKHSQQQEETLQRVQTSLKELQDKMTTLETALQQMTVREKTTRTELHHQVGELELLRKSHRHLSQQQQQRLMEASHHTSVVEQDSNRFQQRILEQLDSMQQQQQQHSVTRSQSRGRSRSVSRPKKTTPRASNQSPFGGLMVDPMTSSAMTPTQRRHLLKRVESHYAQAQQQQQQSRQSSYAQDEEEEEEEEDDESKTYSSYSGYQTEGTTGTTSKHLRRDFSGTTAHTNRMGVPTLYSTRNNTGISTAYHNQPRSMVDHDNDDDDDLEDPTQTTLDTDIDPETDAEQDRLIRDVATAATSGNHSSGDMPMFPYESVFPEAQRFQNVRPKSIAKAVYPDKIVSPRQNKNSKSLSKGKHKNKAKLHAPPATTVGTTNVSANACHNWDFSFTPGFLQQQQPPNTVTTQQ